MIFRIKLIEYQLKKLCFISNRQQKDSTQDYLK